MISCSGLINDMKILNILLYTLHIKNSGLQAFTEGTYDNKMVAKKKNLFERGSEVEYAKIPWQYNMRTDKIDLWS